MRNQAFENRKVPGEQCCHACQAVMRLLACVCQLKLPTCLEAEVSAELHVMLHKAAGIPEFRLACCDMSALRPSCKNLDISHATLCSLMISVLMPLGTASRLHFLSTMHSPSWQHIPTGAFCEALTRLQFQISLTQRCYHICAGGSTPSPSTSSGWPSPRHLSWSRIQACALMGTPAAPTGLPLGSATRTLPT